MGSPHPPGSTLVEALSRGLPGDHLVVDPGVLAAMSQRKQVLSARTIPVREIELWRSIY